MTVIPQRELRNRIGEILREAEGGKTFTISVSGRPVAQLGPLKDGREAVTLSRFLAAHPADNGWGAELAEAREREQGA